MASSLHQQLNRRVGLIALTVAGSMLALAYASVPLYDLFCRTTGFGGTTQRAEAAPAKPVPGKTISIRFDGNVSGGIPWAFRPEKTAVTVPIGQKNLAFYRATNQSAAPVTGHAVYNVSPEDAGRYFVKIACFCFSEQRLQPGQTVEMPVTFFVDPAILKDPVASRISEITLSYTFYPAQRSAQAERSVLPAKNKG